MLVLALGVIGYARQVIRLGRRIAQFQNLQQARLGLVETPHGDLDVGQHHARFGQVAARVVAMGNRVGVTAPVMMTGGVAHNIGVVKALEAKLGYAVQVSAYAQVNGAIGAACLAAA